MHTKPRGQGGLPWHLRLTDLLGRAHNCAGTDVGYQAADALSRRVHGDGKASGTVPARCANKLIERRSTLARSATHSWPLGATTKNAGFAWREAPALDSQLGVPKRGNCTFSRV